MSVLYVPATADLLLLYPGESLNDQIGLWALRHSERQVETSFERSLPEIRTLLQNADTALVDATEDHAQATDAFLQAVARLGAGAVTMYTEAMHDGLELFVRVRGSLVLFGPLFDAQWEEFFRRSLRGKGTLSAARPPGPPRPLSACSLGRRERQRLRFVNRFRNNNFDWPITDINNIN